MAQERGSLCDHDPDQGHLVPGELQNATIEEVELDESVSEDEAIAMALAMCPIGESIVIHERMCALAQGTRCNCTPMTLTPGATA